MQLISAKACQERPKLRKKRDHKALIGLVSERPDCAGVKIDGPSGQGAGLGPPEARQADKLDEVGTFLRIRIELLGADVRHNPLKIFEGGRKPDRFLTLTVFQVSARVLGD